MAAKIKVLQVIKSLGRGGAEMLLPETLRLHDQETFEFHYIYFLPWKDQMVSAIVSCGGRVTCISANNNLQLMLRVPDLVRYISHHQIRVVHSHLPWAGIVARIAGRIARVPVLYTEHNKQERYHGLTRIMNLGTMSWLTEVIAVSEDVKDSISRNKPKLRIPVKTILNGVNTERFSPAFGGAQEIRQRMQIPDDALIVGTIAVFRFQKRLDVWMELASRILKRVDKVHFVIVGDGPLRAELEQKRDSLDLAGRVHFAGLQAEIRPYLALFDLYMMTSIFEGLPIALLEAMSMECAVVTTDAGGIKELVRHETDGLVCGADEPELLENFAVSLLNDPVLRQRLGTQARKRVAGNFSMAKMVADLEAEYRNVSK